MSRRFRAYRYRGRGRHLFRKLVLFFLATWVAIWMLSALLVDAPVIVLVLIFLATLISIPFVLLGLIVFTVGIAMRAMSMAVEAGLPSLLLQRIFYGQARREEPEHPFRSVATEGTEVARLRRRYLAGELTDNEYRFAMMDALKERFARGKMTVTEYERELDKLLQRARVLDDEPSTASLGTPHSR